MDQNRIIVLFYVTSPTFLVVTDVVRSGLGSLVSVSFLIYESHLVIVVRLKVFTGTSLINLVQDLVFS